MLLLCVAPNPPLVYIEGAKAHVVSIDSLWPKIKILLCFHSIKLIKFQLIPDLTIYIFSHNILLFSIKGFYILLLSFSYLTVSIHFTEKISQYEYLCISSYFCSFFNSYFCIVNIKLTKILKLKELVVRDSGTKKIYRLV